MDERTLPVKIEPEEDLENVHHQEVRLKTEIDAKPSVDTKDSICDEIQSNAALPFEYVDVPVIKQEIEGPLKDGLNAQTTLTSSTSSSQQLNGGLQDVLECWDQRRGRSGYGPVNKRAHCYKCDMLRPNPPTVFCERPGIVYPQLTHFLRCQNRHKPDSAHKREGTQLQLV
uniref:Uncharacterized protein n=1 Tax=Timema tahoe TaxID=61484 RepID=A0A7R9FKR2_9NEOP|nr:unnamed protein product [Timema tahoe]